MEDDDEFEDISPEIYDTSDVTFSFHPKRNRKEVILIAKSGSDFNLMKYYLALKSYIERIETEMGIFDSNTNMM